MRNWGDISNYTEQYLNDYPAKRVDYLEYLLSYFFGETKTTLENHLYRIELLNVKHTLSNTPMATTFLHSEIVNISYDEFINRFWRLLFVFERQINASKKSR